MEHAERDSDPAGATGSEPTEETELDEVSGGAAEDAALTDEDE